MRLGVVGTMVWDRIYARDMRSGPIEEWGGVTYTLSAFQAAAPANWRIVPIMKVGRDLRQRAFDFLQTLPALDLEQGLVLVDEPNNRVELRYQDAERRCERLTGGVPPWSWDEIAPLLKNIDALYVNFLSGCELSLETAQRLRIGFHGPIYTDLHSLLLGMDASGMRVPKPLAEWREWIQCFDIVQVNEDELALLSYYWGDPWRFAAEVVGEELRLLLVTLGPRGAVYFAAPSFEGNPLTWRHPGLHVSKKLATPGSVVSEKIAAPTTVLEGDPTGSGDVWGATFFMRLLLGDDVRAAMIEANRAGARNVQYRGATGLHQFLKGRIAG
ncbi:MAG: carbohydrate kinase family protein [Gemmatimonadota bacterium]